MTPPAKQVVSDLLIDSYIRYGDITLFREQIPVSIELYRKAVDLCREQRDGNERMLSSTLYTIGCCYQQVNDNAEAAKAFQESLDILRAFIKEQLKLASEMTDERLVQPSIFDTEEVKDLKGVF